ncbi:hypothetical protein K457DRAFT_131433 [Linnemannia elongata AG-77]|uniref:CCHC-type domain-containing protein n=1 Tax=Linnemannia elongata AG-77 TaxID=1314771 RepID=A0A197JAV6_9FUNG|nr:hypothetical protein K457DRAFT_131433 [Linnemannia elongata AG-77]
MATYEEPSTFAEFSQLAIDIDNRHYGYSLTKSTTTRPSTARAPTTFVAPQRVTAPPSPASSSPSMAMDLSQAQHRAIDSQEKQRRETSNLCRYCGADDYWAKDCSKRPQCSPKPFIKTTQSVSSIQTNSDVVFDLGNDDTYLAKQYNLPLVQHNLAVSLTDGSVYRSHHATRLMQNCQPRLLRPTQSRRTAGFRPIHRAQVHASSYQDEDPDPDLASSPRNQVIQDHESSQKKENPDPAQEYRHVRH